MKQFLNFLTKAKQNSYANGKSLKSASLRLNSKDYHFEDIVNTKKYTYHDTYFGGKKFIGEEVVYIDAKPFWAMNYKGVPITENLTEEVLDKILRSALMQVGADKSVLPLRGPSKFNYEEYTYTFEQSGSIENFTGIERIFKNGIQIYELNCQGGVIE